MSCDEEYICQSCGHTFNSEPPFHERPKRCPRKKCKSDEITTIQEYDETMQINSKESE